MVEPQKDKNRSIDYYAIHFPINNFVDHKASDGAEVHNYRWPANEDGSAPKSVIVML